MGRGGKETGVRVWGGGGGGGTERRRKGGGRGIGEGVWVGWGQKGQKGQKEIAAGF